MSFSAITSCYRFFRAGRPAGRAAGQPAGTDGDWRHLAVLGGTWRQLKGICGKSSKLAGMRQPVDGNSTVPSGDRAFVF